tara:strand:+ start:505 stop:633 length:129 start_codon:yes stop_codon:yes gene_type:complete
MEQKNYFIIDTPAGKKYYSFDRAFSILDKIEDSFDKLSRKQK